MSGDEPISPYDKLRYYSEENLDFWLSKHPADLLARTVTDMMECMTSIERVTQTIHDNPDVEVVTNFDWSEDYRLKQMMTDVLDEAPFQKNVIRILAQYGIRLRYGDNRTSNSKHEAHNPEGQERVMRAPFNKYQHYSLENLDFWLSKSISDLFRPTIPEFMSSVLIVERVAQTIHDNPDIEVVTNFDWSEDYRLKQMMDGVLKQTAILKNILRTLAKYLVVYEQKDGDSQ